MKIFPTLSKVLTAARRLKDHIPPHACGHALALLGHLSHSSALAIAADLLLLMLYLGRRH